MPRCFCSLRYSNSDGPPPTPRHFDLRRRCTYRAPVRRPGRNRRYAVVNASTPKYRRRPSYPGKVQVGRMVRDFLAISLLYQFIVRWGMIMVVKLTTITSEANDITLFASALSLQPSNGMTTRPSDQPPVTLTSQTAHRPVQPRRLPPFRRAGKAANCERADAHPR